MTDARLVRVTGALAEASPMPEAALYELAYVGERRLISEVIRVDGDLGTLQVYEDTNGLSIGEPVELSGQTLTVELGPGLLGSVLDGTGRPLQKVADKAGDFVTPGSSAPTLDPERLWSFAPVVHEGEHVGPGDMLGTVEERPGQSHRILVPPDRGGIVAGVQAGEFTVWETICTLENGQELSLAHRWPVRQPRPAELRLAAGGPLLTGQRIFDFLFPVVEGGSVAVPGGFGTGKTVIEQSLAKYAAADVVVYIGCGERGNEMAEVLSEFPELVDPRTGGSLMDRTLLVVNTSNMPVAAREASIYLGMTVAEYYRDQGMRVAVMADSLSRWAEALREIAARLQEMPGEEGYPTYLGNRLGKIYERTGCVRALGRPERRGSVTLVSAISPPGGDFSEPVTQASLRVTGGLWALDADLAHQRQFPAVDWETSYSLYTALTDPWFAAEVDPRWPDLRGRTLSLLQRDRELREISGLIGPEALQDEDRLLLEAAHIMREVVLGQSAYDPNDAMSPASKTFRLASLTHALFEAAGRALAAGTSYSELDLAEPRHLLAGLRTAPATELEARSAQVQEAIAAIAALAAAPGAAAPAAPEAAGETHPGEEVAGS
jgi:V/A-type H+-transporting ATPase subunit A